MKWLWIGGGIGLGALAAWYFLVQKPKKDKEKQTTSSTQNQQTDNFQSATMTYIVPGTNQTIQVKLHTTSTSNLDSLINTTTHELDQIPTSHFAGLTTLQDDIMRRQLGDNVYDHLTAAQKAEWTSLSSSLGSDPKKIFTDQYVNWLLDSNAVMDSAGRIATSRDVSDLQRAFFIASTFITPSSNGPFMSIYTKAPPIAHDQFFVSRSSTFMFFSVYRFNINTSGQITSIDFGSVKGSTAQAMNIPQAFSDVVPAPAAKASALSVPNSTGASDIVTPQAAQLSIVGTVAPAGTSPIEYVPLTSDAGKVSLDTMSRILSGDPAVVTPGQINAASILSHPVLQK